MASTWLNDAREQEVATQPVARAVTPGHWRGMTRLHVFQAILLVALLDVIGLYVLGIPAIGGAYHPHNSLVTTNSSNDSVPQGGTAPHNFTTIPSNTPAYIAKLLPAARQIHSDIGWPVSVLLAQWIQEHGWGALPDWSGYNFGNVKDDLHCQTTDTGFCYDATVGDGIRDYEIVAGLSYYTSVLPAYKSGGSKAAAIALGESPWDQGGYSECGDGTPGICLLLVMSSDDLVRYD